MTSVACSLHAHRPPEGFKSLRRSKKKCRRMLSSAGVAGGDLKTQLCYREVVKPQRKEPFL